MSSHLPAINVPKISDNTSLLPLTLFASLLPSGSKVVYRVRGAGSNTSEDTGWIAPPTQEEEEEEIRKSLARAKKKMKKNLQIQEWLKNKEDKISEKIQQEVVAGEEDAFVVCVVMFCVGGREESNGGSR